MAIDFDLHIGTAAPELVALLTRAEALAEKLQALPVSAKLRRSLDRLNISRAVRGTTGIEGIEVTEEEAARILETPADRPVLPQTRAQTEHEVRNAALAMEDIATTLREEPGKPVTEAVISRIHRLLTDGVLYEHNIPGVYRSHAVTVGRYSPPRTRNAIERLMPAYIRWLNGPARGLHPIVRAIAAHFYLVSIHPFGDGNGRTSRGVESWILYQAGLNVLGFYSLSNHYYNHHAEYIRCLEQIQTGTTRDLTGFVVFGVGGFVSELEEMWDLALNDLTIGAFERHARALLIEQSRLHAKTGERLYALATGLIEETPVSAIQDGTHRLGRLYRRLSDKTLARDIAYLRERRLIVIHEGVARANLDLVRSGDDALA